MGDINITPSVGAYDYYISVCGAVGGPCANRSAFACQVRKSPIDQLEAVIAYSDVENHIPTPTWGSSASETGNRWEKSLRCRCMMEFGAPVTIASSACCICIML